MTDRDRELNAQGRQPDGSPSTSGFIPPATTPAQPIAQTPESTAAHQAIESALPDIAGAARLAMQRQIGESGD
jgi:hypothetical protein